MERVEKSSKSTFEKYWKIVIFTFDKYQHVTYAYNIHFYFSEGGGSIEVGLKVNYELVDV